MLQENEIEVGDILIELNNDDYVLYVLEIENVPNGLDRVHYYWIGRNEINDCFNRLETLKKLIFYQTVKLIKAEFDENK